MTTIPFTEYQISGISYEQVRQVMMSDDTDDSRSSCDLICVTQALVKQDQLIHKSKGLDKVTWIQVNQKLFEKWLTTLS